MKGWGRVSDHKERCEAEKTLEDMHVVSVVVSFCRQIFRLTQVVLCLPPHIVFIGLMFLGFTFSGTWINTFNNAMFFLDMEV